MARYDERDPTGIIFCSCVFLLLSGLYIVSDDQEKPTKLPPKPSYSLTEIQYRIAGANPYKMRVAKMVEEVIEENMPVKPPEPEATLWYFQVYQNGHLIRSKYNIPEDGQLSCSDKETTNRFIQYKKEINIKLGAQDTLIVGKQKKRIPDDFDVIALSDYLE